MTEAIPKQQQPDEEYDEPRSRADIIGEADQCHIELPDRRRADRMQPVRLGFVESQRETRPHHPHDERQKGQPLTGRFREGGVQADQSQADQDEPRHGEHVRHNPSRRRESLSTLKGRLIGKGSNRRIQDEEDAGYRHRDSAKANAVPSRGHPGSSSLRTRGYPRPARGRER